tara:strand:+ start:363 stop:1238 length:876 start_codon:yes stop_codon:yes gene_type:complete
MKKNKKTLDTLVQDIYASIQPLTQNVQLDIKDSDFDKFGVAMADALKHWATPQPRGSSSLRMSNIGKPSRQLWFDLNAEQNPQQLDPSTMIKFLYGHLLEELVLFFVKLAGHEVTGEQKTIEVEGIQGHMDCIIDGEVVDIKTTSGFAFKKFKEGTLSNDDPFGYIAQLSGYEHSEGTNNGGFLALNKETGELTLFRPDEFDKPNIVNSIKNIKKTVAKKTPPIFCYPTVPEGKAGNFKLAKGCTYCRHKFECHKDSNNGKGLRAFKYAKGATYFTDIKSLPKVEEIQIER